MNRLKSLLLNEYFILYLILANSVLIFIQEFELSSNILNYIEPIFTIVFIVEMFLKINKIGFVKYISDGWNRFDFILIIVSVPSLAVIFYDESHFHLNIFLTLRALRVVKFFRLIRFFPDDATLMCSLKRALKASYIIITGFFLLVFIVSLVTCSLYKRIAPDYFGSPLESIYTIFRLFSIEGWYEIPDYISDHSTPIIGFFSKLYFVFLMFCGGIIGLSLVNSIFVDAMVSDNNDELQKDIYKLSEKIDKMALKIDDLTKNNQQIL